MGAPSSWWMWTVLSGCDMRLEELAGNAALKRQISAQEKGRGLSHAYLISGPKGSGKRTLARLLCASMVCTGGPDRPCGVCPACKKALRGIHPDVIAVRGENGKGISVSQARGVRADAYIRPNEAERKIYIFEDAVSMDLRTQNVLLKLLEEGPAYAAFLLLCENPGGVLETIRSRCEGVSLSPVSRAEAEAYLLARFPDKPAGEVKQAAAACGGLLGQAVDELEGTVDDGPVTEAAERLVNLIGRKDELALAQWAVSLEKWDQDALARLMERAVFLLRDALVLQAGGEAGSGPSQAAQAAAGLPRRVLLGCVTVLERLRADTRFNIGAGHLCGALAAGLAETVHQ